MNNKKTDTAIGGESLVVKKSASQQIKHILCHYTVFIILFIAIVVFSLASPLFMTWSNMMNMLYGNVLTGFLAVGLTFMFVCGYRDMSVGTLMGLCCSLAIYLQKYGLLVSILVPILVGIVIGFINGFLMIRVGVSSFVATFATMFGCKTLTYWITDEQTMGGTIEAFGDFGSGDFLGVKNIVWLFILVVIIGQFVLAKTMHGRNSYAVGSNQNAARNAGINVYRTVIINAIISSVMAAVAGILTAAKINGASPLIGLPDAHLQAQIMTIIGGCSLAGGKGNMFFTMCGMMIIGMIQNFLNLAGFNAYYQTGITGLVLILVLLLNKLINSSNPEAEAK